MKGTGIREERETLINFNDADDLANIYTASETQYRRLKKRGWEPTIDMERHAEFTVPKKFIRVGKNTQGKVKKPRGFGLKPK